MLYAAMAKASRTVPTRGARSCPAWACSSALCGSSSNKRAAITRCPPTFRPRDSGSESRLCCTDLLSSASSTSSGIDGYQRSGASSRPPRSLPSPRESRREPASPRESRRGGCSRLRVARSSSRLWDLSEAVMSLQVVMWASAIATVHQSGNGTISVKGTNLETAPIWKRPIL